MCNISKENKRHTIFFLAFHLKNCTPNVIQKRIFLFQILPSSSLCSHLFSNSNNNNKNNHISMSDVIFTFVVRIMFNFPKYIYIYGKNSFNARCFFQKISRSRLPLKNISSIFPRKINRTGQTIPYEMMNRITIYNPGYVSK